MKKFFFIFFFFQISFNLFSSEIAIIDVDILLSSSKKGKLIIAELKNINDQNISIIKEKEKIIIDLDKEIQSKKNILDEKEIKKKVDQMNIFLKDLESFKIQSNKLYQDKKNQEISNFFKQIEPFLNQFMENNSINFLIDKKNIFISNQKNDITEQLLNLIDKNLK